jgi:hypothetical protein
VRIFSDTVPGFPYTGAQLGRPGRAPWAIDFGGTRMVIDSDAPGQAYEVIRPFLHPDELDKLREEGLQAPSPAASPTATRP